MASLQAGDAVVTAAIGEFKVLLPLAGIERVAQAAMPMALPSGAGSSLAAIRVERDVVPVVFARALLGAEAVTLEPEAKMVLLRSNGRRAFFWVDAVEDVIPFQPFTGEFSLPGEVQKWVTALCDGFPTLAVLDADRIVAAAHGGFSP